MRRIDRDERRSRLVRRQHLDRTGTTIAQVAGEMAGLHSSDPASVYLALWARIPELDAADVEAALYSDRSVLRILGMRRTMFVVPRELAPIMDAATTRGYAAAQRRRLTQAFEATGLTDDGDAWFDAVGSAVVAALDEHGPMTARELTVHVPELAEKLTMTGGTVGASTRILFLLAIEGQIVRGRPRGSWVSSLYEWSTMEGWIGDRLRAVPAPEARASLLERWLSAFGPATERDCAWWTGWGLTDTRRALGDIGAVDVELDGGVGYVVADDAETVEEPVTAEDVALLPGLDPTPMGWKERDWFIGPHTTSLFDRNGNIGPSVWSGGRVVGAWGHAPDGEVVVRLLEPIDSRASDAIAAEADALRAWLGDIRIKARFPTLVEKEIRGA